MGQTPSTPSSKRITPQDRAILDLKLQRDKLRQYRVRIQTLLDAEHAAAAVALRTGNKPLALLCLRRRKYQSTLLSQTDRQLSTLEELTSSIEFALVEQDVLFGLRQGNAVLKQIHKEMTLESVEKLMEETAEGVRYQKEVGEMLAGVMSNEDEDEVEDELEAMQREVVGGRKEDEGRRVEGLPSVPDAVPGAEEAERKAKARERAKARRAEIERQAAEEPMLA